MVEKLTVEELEVFLEEQRFSAQVINAFSINEVSGDQFLLLSELEIKELAPKIRDRINLRELIKKIKAGALVVGTSSQSEPSRSPGLLVEGSSPGGRSTGLLSQAPTLVEGSSPGSSGLSSQAPVDGNWHLNFAVPNKAMLGYSIVEAINSGSVTAAARRRIVTLLRNLMSVHTRYPTPEQYSTVCYKLVEMYPNLKDTVGPVIGSWKISLRNSFKNYRRDRNEKDTCFKRRRLEDVFKEPPSKRGSYEVEESDIEEEAYEDLISEMQALTAKGNNIAKCVKYMKMTWSKRRRWIIEHKPDTQEIMFRFPLLKDLSLFRRDFSLLIGVGLEELKMEWPKWRNIIIKVGKLESRPIIKKFLQQLEAVPHGIYNETDYKDFLSVEIFLRLIFPRKGKTSLFYKHYLTSDADIDGDIAAITQPEPFIVITGEVGRNAQYFIFYEKEQLFESNSFIDSILDIFCVYYNFDICYPKSVLSIFLFFQCFVFNINKSDSKVLPDSLKNFIQLANSVIV